MNTPATVNQSAHKSTHNSTHNCAQASLVTYKSLWGNTRSALEVSELAKQQGFSGLEAPFPNNEKDVSALKQALKAFELDFILEIPTTESYVPDRSASLEKHLNSISKNLEKTDKVRPQFITCLGGCDAWEIQKSVDFFAQAIELAARYELEISFETHRGRSLFTPWATVKIIEQLPQLKLTFDLSHWQVVCEGLQATEEKLIQQLASNAFHIHGRVGYDQGPQVPDPRQGIYQHALNTHLNWWQILWNKQIELGKSQLTVTPEFGPDGYQYRDLRGENDLVNLDEINHFMSEKIKSHFAQSF